MDVKKCGNVLAMAKSEGRITIQFTVIDMGRDLCIVICGGDSPHLGAAALAQCRKSLAAPYEMSASVSVMTLLGHKEDKLAYRIAEGVSRSVGTNVAVLCGIHIEDISNAEIKTVCRIVDELCEEYLQSIR